MQAQGYAREYAKAQVTSVDRSRLLLLVLDGGATFLRQAREGLATGELEPFGTALGRAQAVIGELRGTLDHEAGGKIAADLARLYDFMQFHLTEANARKSLRHLDEVIGVYATIADAFHEIIDRPVARAAAVG